MATFSPTEHRRVLGHLPTGVTVVAAYGPDGPVAMAANSVTSLSLDPPLLLFCPAHTSETWPAIRTAGRFCVNVLAGHHGQLAWKFAARGASRFQDVRWHARPAGPALDEAVAWIECSIRAVHPGGDHAIVVADIDGLDAAAGLQPLVFCHGTFGAFAAELA